MEMTCGEKRHPRETEALAERNAEIVASFWLLVVSKKLITKHVIPEKSGIHCAAGIRNILKFALQILLRSSGSPPSWR